MRFRWFEAGRSLLSCATLAHRSHEQPWVAGINVLGIADFLAETSYS